MVDLEASSFLPDSLEPRLEELLVSLVFNCDDSTLLLEWPADADPEARDSDWGVLSDFDTNAELLLLRNKQ
jgi:hypothetical protein